MVAALVLAEISGIDSLGFFDAILWSLVAELMYYTMYPLIRRLIERVGMGAVVSGAFLLSLAVILTDPSAKVTACTVGSSTGCSACLAGCWV